MLRLSHFPLCPYCRKVRLALAEKGLEFELHEVEPWRNAERLIEDNPAGEVPVLEHDLFVLSESTAIAEYLEEAFPAPALLGTDKYARAEIRRLVAMFDSKFAREVTDPLWRQKLIFRLKKKGQPDSKAMREAAAELKGHLDYIGYLALSRNWLAGDQLSLADLAAAAHLSVLDYLGDVPWDACSDAKEWYARIKSRPGFRPLLADRIAAQRPPEHYSDLDF